jgi:hypothetical protein
MNTTLLSNDFPERPSFQPRPMAWVGLDWGDKEHAFVLCDDTGRCEKGKLEHGAEHLHHWLKGIGQRYGGRPVALAIEASRGAVIHGLLEYAWLIIYPVNPVTSARYRSAFKPSGAKDDLPDAEVLLELVRFHANKLRALATQDPNTIRLAGLVEARRHLVDRRTAVLNELMALLKSYYPQALDLLNNLNSELAVAFLQRWPDLISLKAARPATIRRFYYQHQVRSSKLVEERLARISRAVALTTDEARVSVARLKLSCLVEQLELFRKQVVCFEAKSKRPLRPTKMQHCSATFPALALNWHRVCVWLSVPSALSTPIRPACRSLPAWHRSSRRADLSLGPIGAGAPPSFYGKRLSNGPDRRSAIPPGPGFIISGCSRREKSMRSSCGRWHLNGSASFGNVGKRKPAMMKPVTFESCTAAKAPTT